MSGSDVSVKFALSKDHDGYFKSAFAKDLISNKPNNMYNSSVSLLNSDDMDIVSDPEDIHVQFGLKRTSNSFVWQKQLQSDCRSLLEDNRRSLGLARLPQGEELGGRLHSSILQSEVESLRWRLKESEESRMIYRRSVQELVRFLERAHSRMGSLAAYLAGETTAPANGSESPPNAATVSTANCTSTPDRRNSDAFTRRPNETLDSNSPSPPSNRDFTWRRPRRAVSVPRELDPTRIADEASRLHRLATSLLQTGAPWLTDSASRHDPHDSLSEGPLSSDDHQLSNEDRQLPMMDDRRLPAICCGTSTPERRQSSSSSASSIGSSVTAHPTSNSSMSSAFTRVGSLQKSRLSSSEDSNSTTSKDGDCRLVRASIHIPASKKDFVRRPSSGIPLSGSKLSRADIQSCTSNKIANNMEASSSSSSTENESGFSSMNSFHEIGLPLVNSTAVLNSSSLSSSSDESRTIVHRDDTLKRKSINHDKRLSLDQRSLNQLEKGPSFLDRNFINDKNTDRRSSFERSSIIERRSCSDRLSTVDRRLSFDQNSSNVRESINERRLSYFEKTLESTNSSPEKKSVFDQKRSILDARWGSPSTNSVLYDRTHERVTLKSDDIRVLWV